MKQSNKCACARVSAGIFAAARLLELCGSSQPSTGRGSDTQYKVLLYLDRIKNLLFFLLLASATAAAQKNQLSIGAVGNFNPVTYVYINQVPSTMGSSQKSSIGGGLEYDHWFKPYLANGVIYEQNPSDGKLLEGNGRIWSIWPQMRYEFLDMFTEQVGVNRFTPFIQEGAGTVVTHEYGDGNAAGAGWSHSLAFAAGFGSYYWINNRFAVRLSTIILDDQTGCYDDPTCRPTWGLSHDLEAGFSWAWGRTKE